MSETEVGKVLISIGASLGRSPTAMHQFIQTIVVDGWYDTLDSLQNLTDDQWARFQLPRRLEELLRQKVEEVGNIPKLEPIRAAAPASSSNLLNASSVVDRVEADNRPSGFKVEVAPAQLNDALSIPVPMLIEAIREEIFSVVNDTPEVMYHECLALISRIVGNILGDPHNAKFRSVRLDNVKFSQFVGRWTCAENLLKACGFEKGDDSIVCKIVYISRFTDVLESLKLAIGEDASITVGSNTFNPFKSSITNAGDTFGVPQGRLAEERDAEIDAVRTEADQLRKQLATPSGKGKPLAPPKLVPLDTPFDISQTPDNMEDTSLLLANMRSIAAAGENALKFKSREKMELEKLRARKQFTKTTVRILFQDKVGLDIVVNAGETVEGVYGILTSCLNDRMKRTTDWVLTVSPPLQRLSRSSKATMIQEEFVPSVVMRMMMNGQLCVSSHVLDSAYISIT
jgi:hypothetical protein